MKVCSKCGVEKGEEAFSKHSTMKDGLRSACKVCLNAENAKWRVENIDAVRAKGRESNAVWRANNPEVAAARYAAWVANNPGKNASRAAAWRANNPEKYAARAAAYREADREKNRARAARCRDTLTDGFVANRLKIKSAPPELIELKREQIKIRRITKQLQQTIKEKQDE